MSRLIRKYVRHCGRYGLRAHFIQVAYFPYTVPRKSGRQRKFQESTPAVRNLNNRNARRYLEALVETNFKRDDLLASLTYSEENMPEDIEGAKRRFHNFIRRVNRKRKKMGIPNAKYIVVTEINSKGKAHHHVIMDAMLDRDTVEKIWGQGRANTKRLQPDTKRHLLPVIDYIAKAFKETEDKPQRMRRWDCSKGNLLKPWVSINDNPRMMSHKKMRLMQDIPVDSECMKRIIELDNPHYELISVEREYAEESGEWHFFCRMRLASSCENPVNFVDKHDSKQKRENRDKCKKQEGHGNARAKPPPRGTGPP